MLTTPSVRFFEVLKVFIGRRTYLEPRISVRDGIFKQDIHRSTVGFPEDEPAWSWPLEVSEAK